MSKNSTSFKKGNIVAASWTLQSATDMFERALRNTENEDLKIASLTDVWRSVGVYKSTIKHLLERFPELQDYRDDINDMIINKLHKGAIVGRYKAAPVIWRFKQMGETDKVENTNIEIQKKVVVKLGEKPAE